MIDALFDLAERMNSENVTKNCNQMDNRMSERTKQTMINVLNSFSTVMLLRKKVE